MNVLMWNYKADNRIINMAAEEYHNGFLLNRVS
jgi:hypothetical protein